MSHWQQTPDDSCKAQNFRIYRTPVGREVTLVALSKTFIGAKLHYWRGRSTPCAGNDCQACKEGQRPRWKGFLFAYHRDTRTVVIFEFTDRGYEPMQETLERHKSLRGLLFKASRLNKRPNGPIQITFSDTREESPHLPNPEGLHEMLERIWEIRQNTFDFEPQILHS